MIKDQKGNLAIVLVLVVLVILGLIAGIYLVKGGTNILPSASEDSSQEQPLRVEKMDNTSPASTEAPIKSAGELMEVSKELDSSDVEAIDTELNQNSNDATNF